MEKDIFRSHKVLDEYPNVSVRGGQPFYKALVREVSEDPQIIKLCPLPLVASWNKLEEPYC